MEIIDRVMLISAAEGNPHGWGISTEDTLWKKGENYIYSDRVWMDELPTVSFTSILAHVRAASAGTRISDAEAQPFQFETFTVMHNGTFYRSHNGSDVPEDSPNSDTYRVFHKLLNNRDEWIDKESIQQWLTSYERQSSFAVIIKRGINIALFRNEQRMLYYSTVGNGFFVTTSLNVAKYVTKWAQKQFQITISEPQMLAANMLWNIQVGEPILQGQSLSFNNMLNRRRFTRRNISFIRRKGSV